jgi:S1-C subfamily serine protease
MQAALIRLTGRERGRVEAVEEDPLRLGTHLANTIVVDGRQWPSVDPFHAEIRQEDGTYRLVDVSSAGLWVNGKRVSESLLHDRDSFQVGEGGPQFRFRLRGGPGKGRSFPAILSDSHAIARSGEHAPLVSATTFVRHVILGVAREASWGARLAAALAVLLLAGFLAATPLLLLREHHLSEETRAAMGALAAQLREERVTREELGKRVEAEQGRLAAQEGEVSRLGEERERLRAALAATETRLRRLEEDAALAERIIARSSGGIALIQGSVGFRDGSGRWLRFLEMDASGQPRRNPLGQPLLSPEGAGPVATTPFTGSGFLVHADGRILTNRHIVEPWRGEEELEPLLAAGLKPELRMFRAFFPGLREAVPLTVLAVASEGDVALLRGVLGRARPPVLEVDRAGRDAVRGRSVILLGYPAGIEALLARANAQAVQELLTGGIPDVYRLADLMAARGMIRPYVTQGHLADVQSHQLSYDAPTAVGGSGGPLIAKSGRVVGINYAILRGFTGSSFGIPIRIGVELLRKHAPS